MTAASRVSAACVALLLGVSLCGSAFAQTGEDALQESREQFMAAYREVQGSSERYTAQSTTGDRLRREAAAAAIRFAEMGERAIVEGDVPPALVATAWDDVLTARQIAAALWLEVGACGQASAELRDLAIHEETDRRPVIAEAVATQALEAEQCEERSAPTELASIEEPIARGPEPSEDPPAEAAGQNAANNSGTEPSPGSGGPTGNSLVEVSPARLRTRAGNALLGTSAGLVAIATTLTVLTDRAERDANTARSGSERSLEVYSSARDRHSRSQRSSVAAWSLAAATALGGATLRFSARPDDAISLSMSPSLEGAVLGAEW